MVTEKTKRTLQFEHVWDAHSLELFLFCTNLSISLWNPPICLPGNVCGSLIFSAPPSGQTYWHLRQIIHPRLSSCKPEKPEFTGFTTCISHRWRQAMGTLSALFTLCRGNPLGSSGSYELLSFVTAGLKRLMKYSPSHQWFKTPWWRCNITVMCLVWYEFSTKIETRSWSPLYAQKSVVSGCLSIRRYRLVTSLYMTDFNISSFDRDFRQMDDIIRTEWENLATFRG